MNFLDLMIHLLDKLTILVRMCETVGSLLKENKSQDTDENSTINP